MNILQKLTKRELKLNKKRTLGTLVGIILATALITAVGGLAVTIKNSGFETVKNNIGYLHIILFGISNEQVEELKINNDYNHYEVINDLGVSVQKDTYSDVYSMNRETLDYFKTKIIEGDFPKNENEVLIGINLANNLKYKIGDEITAKIENEPEINIEQNPQIDLNQKEYKFTISGIFTSYVFPETSLITTNIDSEKNDMYLTLKNPKNCKKDFEELLGINPYKNNQTKKAKYEYKVINDILKWEVGAFGDRTTKLLYGMIGIILLIILVMSVFSIRNSFKISTTEKQKTYGMLSSVGATKKQIRKMVLYEARRLGFVGITIGCVLGTSVVYILVQIVNNIMRNKSK